MSGYVFIPGAGGVGWGWHRVVALLRERGHDAVAVDLPGDDPAQGLPEYVDIVVGAIGGRSDVHLVAASLGGFTAAMVAEQVPLKSLTLVNAMIPMPDETPGAWWDNTGAPQARMAAAEANGYPIEFEVDTYFTHDLDAEQRERLAQLARDEADIVFDQRCAFGRWPDIPLRAVAGRDDRFFPVDFQRRVARSRLGLDLIDVPGGHLAALSHPEVMAAALPS